MMMMMMVQQVSLRSNLQRLFWLWEIRVQRGVTNASYSDHLFEPCIIDRTPLVHYVLVEARTRKIVSYAIVNQEQGSMP